MWYSRFTKSNHARLIFPLTLALPPNKYDLFIRKIPLVLRILAISLLLLSLANPQTTTLVKQKVPVEGIDIVMVSDVSQSMLAEDLKPNRIEALKAVATRFIAQRPGDRIGLVVYAGESFTSAPLTTNHTHLVKQLHRMDEVPLADGTAIGLGLATAVNRLKSSKSKSKIAILMTDGENNAGYISPQKATDIALKYGVKVYTIGMGTHGQAPYPVVNVSGKKEWMQVPVRIDTVLLKTIAYKTGGLFFYANDNQALEKIYHQINQLEKTEITHKQVVQHQSVFEWFALPAFCLLILELLIRFTLFKRVL
jgi:Ca-activated chloride channel family protein